MPTSDASPADWSGLEPHHGVFSQTLNDISIIALARTLELPVVSMETKLPPDAKWKRIPCICGLEAVEHLTFNDFLRKEGIVL